MEKSAQVKRKTQSARPALPGRLLPRSFFEHSPELVAPRLLGKLLVHRSHAGILAGSIVEVEAYLGPHNDPPDPAAHSHRGPTPRNEVLFGPAGHAYVYAIYGRYFCMNISCESEGLAGCVLLRALEPVAGADLMAANRGLPSGAAPRLLTAGPSRLCQALGLTRKTHNGLDVTSAIRRCRCATTVAASRRCSSRCASASSMRSTGRFDSRFRGTSASREQRI